jgi:nucleoside-diphosphate-sugar epimerase
MEAFAAGARLGVEVVVVNPSYVFGAPVDRMLPGETSTRMIGNYLRERLAALVDGQTNVVDVIDVAHGHLRAAERGAPGERYVRGGHDLRWVESRPSPLSVAAAGLRLAGRTGLLTGLRIAEGRLGRRLVVGG